MVVPDSSVCVDGKPVVSLVATPGKRRAIIEIAQEAERRGYPAIAAPSLGGAMSLCASLAHETSTIGFFTSIQPIYLGSPREMAASAAHIHEISGGRFALGLGISHVPMMRRFGVTVSDVRPLSDMSEYVEALRAAGDYAGELPPIYLATLRDRMLGLATSSAEGALWANASRRDLPRQAAAARAARPTEFAMACMVPTVISDDMAAARAIHRRTMMTYVGLPNYRNYWRAAGWVAEMDAIEAALDARQRDRLPELMSDAWLDDCTLSGPAEVIRAGLAGYAEMGVTPIAVMSSTSGGQARAISELFAIYD